MKASEYEKPLPKPDLDSEKFWEGCRNHKLLIQKCKECGTHRFPPDSMCYMCQSKEYEWTDTEGKGKIYTWIVVHYSPHRAFEGDIPYTVAYVELDKPKNIRICGNILDCEDEEIYAGMPVEVVFDDVTHKATLPKWKPTKICQRV